MPKILKNDDFFPILVPDAKKNIGFCLEMRSQISRRPYETLFVSKYNIKNHT